MESIGVSELRANLTGFLKKVETGQIINITSRGRKIAKLVPPNYATAVAREQLKQLRQTAVVGDVITPGEDMWDVTT